MKGEWRLIKSGRCRASLNMALDEAIAVSVRKNGLSPTLRLYGWDMPSVSLGCFQKTSEIDSGYCAAHDIPIVRRLTGGRAILHGEELTYSFSTRTDAPPFTKGLLESYRLISEALTLAFSKIGVAADAKRQREKGSVLAGSPLCFRSSSYGEILVNRRKVVGSAQKRWEDGLLQQGSIPYDFRKEDLRKIFRLGDDEAGMHMAGLREVAPDFDEETFRGAVISAFEEAFAITLLPSVPTEEELSLSLALEKEKYLHPQWTRGR